jgi:hypothetical protein
MLVALAGLPRAAHAAPPVPVAKLVAAGGAPNDGFGNWVSLDGNTAIAGAPYTDVDGRAEQGAAYVYYRDQGGPNAWGQVARLIASDGEAYDYFGSVALSGDTAVVGAFKATVNGQWWQGAAYVFYRNQGGPDAWGQVAKLTASDGAATDFFGAAVAVDGDTIMVGANQWYSKPGAVYVYFRNQGGQDAWGQVVKLTASDVGGNEYFGGAVTLDGDTAVIAAAYTPSGGDKPLQGAAYVFYRNQGGPDAWGEVAKLTASDAAAWDLFGNQVSLSGDTVIIGSPKADVNGNTDQGAAYIFHRNQGGPDAWGQVAKLTASDGGAWECLGSVSVSGDTAIVATAFCQWECYGAQGAAYLYQRNQGGANAWGQTDKLTTGEAGDKFGMGVSLQGNTAVVGAFSADVGGNVDQGAAYVYYGMQPNQPPNCSAAAASPALLWPPNNKFVPVSIGGVADADGDPLTLAVTGIRQDEPVGTGNKAPDGRGVGTATAELRAEKLGSGDGRVYHVSFTASDGHGGACTGEVRVSVPHDQARPAVDGGPLYDSTVPTP